MVIVSFADGCKEQELVEEHDQQAKANVYPLKTST